MASAATSDARRPLRTGASVVVNGFAAPASGAVNDDRNWRLRSSSDLAYATELPGVFHRNAIGVSSADPASALETAIARFPIAAAIESASASMPMTTAA